MVAPSARVEFLLGFPGVFDDGLAESARTHAVGPCLVSGDVRRRPTREAKRARMASFEGIGARVVE